MLDILAGHLRGFIHERCCGFVGGFHAPAQKKPADIPAVTHFLFPFPLDFVARVFPSACYEHSDVCS